LRRAVGEHAQESSYSPAVIATATVALLLPVAGLVLLVAEPDFDLVWEHHPAHFWLVLACAALSAVIAYATGAAAVQRGDARVLLVSLSFLSAAGFLGLHALATPGVLLSTPNAGFTVATPIGLAIASLFAAWSSVDLSGERAMRTLRVARRARIVLLLSMVVWAAVSLAQLPPLDQESPPERASGPMLMIAVPAIVLYAVAAVRYVMLWRRRPSVMLLAMLAAFVLLAEAMVAVVFARNWRLSWWEWHVLMLAAFALVAVGARMQWREERFADLYTEETLSGTRVISILFADLQGFTRFAEGHPATEVSAMLNAYFEVAVPPVVRRFGGEVDRIIGDALMVTFNKGGDQPDHARRAAAAGLALQEATGAVGAAHPDWPRFRVGVNSGEVSIGVLGTAGGRTYTVIGDAVNVASRIEGKAPGGGVAIGPGTKALLPDAVTESLGRLELKGKSEPIEVHLLHALGPDAAVTG
jgi:adenylate cyclase